MNHRTGAQRPRASRAILLLLAVLATACGRSDTAIAQEIRARFEARPALRAADIEVIAKKGIVLLRGRAAGIAQQREAVALAADVPGVHTVLDQLLLTDAAIVAEIEEAFRMDPLLSAVPIDVVSTNGTVRLVSAATNADQRDRAIALARAIRGVVRVEDEMK